MKSMLGIAIAILYPTVGPKGWFHTPQKGKCPFKDGNMKKLTEHKGIVIGPGESTVDIWGKDSVVLSATDGRVTDIVKLTFRI